MKIDSSAPYTKELQGLTSEEDTEETAVSENEFDLYLKGLLQPNGENKVSEEELFAALVSERLKKEKGQDLSDKFNGLMSANKSLLSFQGYTPVEDAAKGALRELRDSGDLTAEEADAIYSSAFAAAQLDQNKGALYDGRGLPGDETVALEDLEQALLSARVQMAEYDSGEDEAEKRSLDESSNSVGALQIPFANSPDFSDVSSHSVEVSDSKPSRKDDDFNPADLELALDFSGAANGQHTAEFIKSLLEID